MLLLIRIFGRIYLLLFLGIARVKLRGERKIIEAFLRTLSGESRSLVAFRHAYGGEPQLLTWFFIFRLRHFAKRIGISFPRRPLAAFVYGYEVPRWGGPIARWLMPRIGAMPIHHAKMDSAGMARIYAALENGPYPVAIAPEGQVSYTSEHIPRLEQGTVRIGFHSADHLSKKGKDVSVEIIPVSIHFRYGKLGKAALNRMLRKIEHYIGKGIRANDPRSEDFITRITQARDKILEMNERRYGLQLGRGKPFAERMDAVIGAALNTAEDMLGMKRGSADIIDRVYAVRQLSWDRIFLPGKENLDLLCKAERSIADLRAGEAWYASRHMELVDFSWYFRNHLPTQTTPTHLKIEYVQNLWDFLNRTMGGAYADRVNIHPKTVIIQAGNPINLSERLPAYKEDRKEAIALALSDLEQEFLSCIEEVKKADFGTASV